MKIVVVHGSPRKGNTYAATQVFMEEMRKQGPVEFSEYFLPKDMPEFCCGCMICFLKSEELCPHAKYTLPVLDDMLKADALIFSTPVFVFQASGCMKSFLDHYGHLFIVHRARPEMFRKKAFIISSTAGAGTKAAIKTINASLRYWGINRVYSLAFATFGDEWKSMKTDKKSKINSRIKKKAVRFYREVASGKRHHPYFLIRLMFIVRKIMMKKFDDDSSVDKKYWMKNGWLQGTNSPFKS